MPGFHQEFDNEKQALNDLAVTLKDGIESGAAIAVIVVKQTGEVVMTRANTETVEELIKFGAVILSEIRNHMPTQRDIDIFRRIADARDSFG